MHEARQVFWFIFNLRIKKNRSVIHTIIGYYNRHTQWSFSCQIVQTVHVYILEQLGFVSTAAKKNESILAHLSKQTESSCSPHDLGRLNCFPHWWLGLAIFSLTAQILLLIKVPDLNSYKSHRYNITAKTTQSTAQQLYTRTFLLFSIFHTGELKRPVGPKSLCRAHHCYTYVVPTYSWYWTYCEFTAVRWTDINCLNTWVNSYRKVPSQARRESSWSPGGQITPLPANHAPAYDQ
jgi:hypothetical protein